jgi:hypothetical protein
MIDNGKKRATGIEPAWPAWKAGTLPLSYARVKINCRGVVALPSAFSAGALTLAIFAVGV